MQSFVDRLLGLHRAPIGAQVVVIPGSSVHGVTLGQPLTYIARTPMSERGASRQLKPWRFAWIRGAVAIAEFPDGLFCQAEHDIHHIQWYR